MSPLVPCLLTALLAANPATVNTLDGKTITGELTAFANEQLVLTVETETTTLPLANVLEMNWTVPVVAPADLPEIQLTDRSLLRSSFTITGDNVALNGPSAMLQVSKRLVRSVRFMPLDNKIAAAWDELRARQPKEDLLVVRKGDVLDFIAGAVGDVTSENVAVVTGGRDLQAPVAKLFGLLLAERPEPRGRAQGEVLLATGERLVAESITWTAEHWVVKLKSGLELNVPLITVQKIDFGGGRIRPLADLPFTTAGSTSPDPLFPVDWYTSRNAPAGFGPEGKPLKIGEVEYTRGLWMCSNAEVRFRLNREFTRLQTVAGFELTFAERMSKYNPQAELVIEADGRELFRRTLNWNDPPQPLDLDLTDTRELVVKVISKSAHPGVLEFVALGDARLLK